MVKILNRFKRFCFDQLNRNGLFASLITLVFLCAFSQISTKGQDLGAMWGTAKEENKYYTITDIPIPPGVPMRPGSFEVLPDERLAYN